MKKLLALVLAAVAVLSVIAFNAIADDTALTTSDTESKKLAEGKCVYVYDATLESKCDAYGLFDCTGWNGDSDQDGLCNDWETYLYGTDPKDWDTDDGGACDGDEVLIDETDPHDPTDDLL